MRTVHSFRLFPTVLALLAPLSTPVAAQGARRVLPPKVLDAAGERVLHAACRVERHDGLLRAGGPDYSAVLTPAGVRFMPALGRRAPRALPLDLATVSVARETGSNAALLDVAPGDQGLITRYARGQGIVESWHARPEGMELAYTFAAPLPGQGDLVVRLSVATELTPVARPAGAQDIALRLHAPPVDGRPIGGVRIGGVTGIDAAGRKCRGSARLDAGFLELRLPGEFVDQAVHPLVLDPLIGTDFAVNPVGDQASPDAAYDSASQRYLVAWEQELNLTNSQVVGRLIDVQGNPVGASLLIRYTPGAQARDPLVASVRGSGRFLVAWLEAPGFLGPWEIACRCVNADGSMSSVVQTGVAVRADWARPALGGNAHASDTHALLAWSAGTSVLAQRISVPAGSVPPVLVGAPIAMTTGSPLAIPSLFMTPGAVIGGRWVVFHSRFDFGGPTSLRARAVSSSSGALLGTELDLGPRTGHSSQVVDGDGANYLLASLRDGDVWCQKLVWSAANLSLSGSEIQVTASPTGKTELQIAHLGPKTLLVWSDDGGVPLGNDIRGLALDPGTCQSCDLPILLARAGSYDAQPAIAAQYSANPNAGDQALIVFSSAPLAPPFAGEIRGQRFEAIGPGGAFTNVGGGCGRPLTMSAVGPIAVGNQGANFQLSGVTGALAVFFSIGVPGAPTVPCGLCQVTVPLLLPLARFGGDRAVQPLGVGCDMSVLGAQFELQGWMLGSTESPCPLVPGMSFSDRHVATIGL